MYRCCTNPTTDPLTNRKTPKFWRQISGLDPSSNVGVWWTLRTVREHYSTIVTTTVTTTKYIFKNLTIYEYTSKLIYKWFTTTLYIVLPAAACNSHVSHRSRFSIWRVQWTVNSGYFVTSVFSLPLLTLPTSIFLSVSPTANLSCSRSPPDDNNTWDQNTYCNWTNSWRSPCCLVVFTLM